jgi:hypothetical protein
VRGAADEELGELAVEAGAELAGVELTGTVAELELLEVPGMVQLERTMMAAPAAKTPMLLDTRQADAITAGSGRPVPPVCMCAT